ncbi:hypothetical protein V6N13_101558 [Hibiscus sabdariffa]
MRHQVTKELGFSLFFGHTRWLALVNLRGDWQTTSFQPLHHLHRQDRRLESLVSLSSLPSMEIFGILAVGVNVHGFGTELPVYIVSCSISSPREMLWSVSQVGFSTGEGRAL